MERPVKKENRKISLLRNEFFPPQKSKKSVRGIEASEEKKNFSRNGKSPSGKKTPADKIYNTNEPNKEKRSFLPNKKKSSRKQLDGKQGDLIRLNRFIANAGICSRREADDYIKAGIIRVNGKIITEVGTKVKITDKVLFHNEPVQREKKVYILLNKPKNTITTTDDPQGRNTVMKIVKDACQERVYPVGRLDRNTTGVLLLTNDGDLAEKLLHPKFQKRKVYDVHLNTEFSTEDEKQLLNGINIENEIVTPDQMMVDKDRKHIGIEIHSGQNRVVRRIFEKMGYKVVKLDRVCFAGLTKKGLTRGKYRFLSPKEVSMLQMGAFK